MVVALNLERLASDIEPEDMQVGKMMALLEIQKGN